MWTGQFRRCTSCNFAISMNCFFTTNSSCFLFDHAQSIIFASCCRRNGHIFLSSVRVCNDTMCLDDHHDGSFRNEMFDCFFLAISKTNYQPIHWSFLFVFQSKWLIAINKNQRRGNRPKHENHRTLGNEWFCCYCSPKTIVFAWCNQFYETKFYETNRMAKYSSKSAIFMILWITLCEMVRLWALKRLELA